MKRGILLGLLMAYGLYRLWGWWRSLSDPFGVTPEMKGRGYW